MNSTEIEVDGVTVEAPTKVSLVDVDGGCPDYLVVNLKWVAAGVFSLITGGIAYVL